MAHRQQTDVTVKDHIPAGLAFSGAIASKGTYSNFLGLWTIGEIASGETVTLELDVFTTDVSAPITNFAQVKTALPDDPDSTPGNDTDGTPDEDDEDDATIVPEGGTPLADIELTKSADVSNAQVGDIFNYTLIVTNNGPADATNVKIQDVLSTDLMLMSSVATVGSYNSAIGTWSIGNLAKNASASLTLMVQVLNMDDPIVNFAQVYSASPGDPDSTPGNDTNQTPDEDDEASVTVSPVVPDMVDLELTKTADVAQASDGDIVNYTIVVTNTGLSDASGVSVEALMPTGLSFNSASPSVGSFNAATGIWTLGSLLSGDSETITINVSVTDISTPITCFAQVENGFPQRCGLHTGQ